MKDLVRPARKPLYLPNEQDDYDRHWERSWKYQSNRRKQHGFDAAKIRNFKRQTEADWLEE